MPSPCGAGLPAETVAVVTSPSGMWRFNDATGECPEGRQRAVDFAAMIVRSERFRGLDT